MFYSVKFKYGVYRHCSFFDYLILQKFIKRYRKDTKNFYSPPFKELEEFRIKRYNTSGDERFDEHVDVTDYNSSLRGVAFLFYLNDNDGNTLFPLHDLNIQPVSGRVINIPTNLGLSTFRITS